VLCQIVPCILIAWVQTTIRELRRKSMKLKNEVVYFYSEPGVFKREKSGRKNNTIKLLSELEYEMTLWMQIDKIEIRNIQTEERIRRNVTDISLVARILGFNLVCFSWKGQVEE
jgi:hypothetical protein